MRTFVDSVQCVQTECAVTHINMDIESDAHENGLVKLVDVFHQHCISGYLDGEDVIRLSQCGSKRLNRTLRREAVALRFSTWHTRFTNMFRLFCFLAEYFPHVGELEMDFVGEFSHWPRLTQEVGTGDPQPSAEMMNKLTNTSLPNLSCIVAREHNYNLVSIYLARFFNTMADRTTTIFPLLQTLIVQCDASSKYDEHVNAFIHYTPASVSCLKLDFLDDVRRPLIVNFDTTNARGGRGIPKLSLSSLQLKLAESLPWTALESAYNLADLTSLELIGHEKIALDCGILPRLLRHLKISFVAAQTHSDFQNGGRSVVHFRNAPPRLETVILYTVEQVVMHEVLPSTLQVFEIGSRTILTDNDGFITIPFLPTRLKSLPRCNYASRDLDRLSSLSEHLLRRLMHQSREQVESVLKHLPPHLPIVVDYSIAEWLRSFTHMPQLKTIAITTPLKICTTIYRYAIEVDGGMDVDKRQALEVLAEEALMLHVSFKHVNGTPRKAPLQLRSSEPHSLAMLAGVAILTIHGEISKPGFNCYVGLHDKLEARTRCAFDSSDALGIISACTRLQHLCVTLGKYDDLDAVLSHLPRTLRTLAITSAVGGTMARTNISLLHPEMQLRQLNIKGVFFEAPAVAQLINDIKSIKSFNQLVLSVTLSREINDIRRDISTVTVHCHSVNVDALLATELSK